MPRLAAVARPSFARRESVVSTLEEALEAAKAGHVQSFALVTVGPDGHATYWDTTSGSDRPFLYMAIDRLKHRLFRSYYEADDRG
jgi:hypothetical protein